MSKEAQGGIPNELIKIKRAAYSKSVINLQYNVWAVFQRDVFDGIVSPEEKEFWNRTK